MNIKKSILITKMNMKKLVNYKERRKYQTTSKYQKKNKPQKHSIKELSRVLEVLYRTQC